MGNKKNKARLVKPRRFKGNRYTGKINSCLQHSSSTKISPDSSYLVVDEEQITDDFFFIMHFGLLKNLVEEISCCPTCKGHVTLRMIFSDKMGLSQKLCISCDTCDWSNAMFTSPEVKSEGQKQPGLNKFEVNVRTIMSFREFGKGLEAIKVFSSIMNMPQPMNQKAYNNINESLHEIYSNVAAKCMQKNATEVRLINKIPSDDIGDCDVSIDGTYQKRGHSSLNGVVSAISKDTKKVIDLHIMSKFCRPCAIWEKKKDTPEYESWKNEHECNINHTGSSGAMEAAGALEIFNSSVAKFSLRYAHFIGDGDSSSFRTVALSKPYGDDFIPEKWECLGHVQKRLGTRLRNFRKEQRHKVLTDGKKIAGKGRLTDKVINTLQNYFGMAIRSSKELYQMKKAIGAVLWHCTDLPETQRHMFCPQSADSWCKWQKNKLNGTSNVKSKVNLPVAIKNIIEPIFRDLSSDELLSKCLHSCTQNPNEAFNQIIWTKCPKSVFVSRQVFELSVFSAVINFNEGFSAIQMVFQELGISAGQFFMHGGSKKDTSRVRNILRKSSESVQKRRKKLRAIRKGFIDNEKELEGQNLYEGGAF